MDFLKRMQEKKAAQRNEKLPELLAPTSEPQNSTKVTGPSQTLSHLDKLVYLRDECKLNGWESSFTASVIAYLRKWPENKPSVKQAAKIDSMFEDFDLADAVGDGFLYAGYATDVLEDQVRQVPVKEIKKITDAYESRGEAKVDKYGFDDYDDDIPF